MKRISTIAGLMAGGIALTMAPALAHEVIHSNHIAVHSDGDGHTVVNHAGHMDHLHNGHLHSMHDAHIDEHVIDISAANPAGEGSGGHDAHMHAADDGHEMVQHGDHFDHMHDGHLHNMHGDHTDEHGAVKVVG